MAPLPCLPRAAGSRMTTNQAQHTASKIKSAASELFAERGFHATTTRQIAACAGVNEVTLFRHFGSKSELFDRVLEEMHRLYPPEQHMAQAGGGGALATVRTLCEAFLQRVKLRPDLYRLMLQAMGDQVNAVRRDIVATRMGQYELLLGKCFRELAPAQAGTATPEVRARMVMHLLIGIGLRSHLQGEFDLIDPQALAAQIVEIMCTS